MRRSVGALSEITGAILGLTCALIGYLIAGLPGELAGLGIGALLAIFTGIWMGKNL